MDGLVEVTVTSRNDLKVGLKCPEQTAMPKVLQQI